MVNYSISGGKNASHIIIAIKDMRFGVSYEQFTVGESLLQEGVVLISKISPSCRRSSKRQGFF